jgi:hypothetical protein
MADRTYLNVPFAEKDCARDLGARWDPEVKRWYVPEHFPVQPFARWHASIVDVLLMVAPVPLIQATAVCWKCRGRSPVFCLACRDVRESSDTRASYQHDDELLLISDLISVDRQIQQHLRAVASDYRPDWSNTKGHRCWMNHCRDCGAKMGDFFLHCEPDGPFCVPTEAAWRRMRQHLLERDGEYAFDGTYNL